MKIFVVWIIFLVVLTGAHAQSGKPVSDSANLKASNFNSHPEMKEYWFVMLTRGINRNQDSATSAKIQEGHIANINRLAKEGKLIVAGPFGDEGNWRGIFILNCRDKSEAEQLIKNDPAITTGRLNYEIHSWWTLKNDFFK